VILEDGNDRFYRNVRNYLLIYAALRDIAEDTRPLHSTVGQHLRHSSTLIELEDLEGYTEKDHTSIFLRNWPFLKLVTTNILEVL
jgi:hypothetical protein